MNTNPAGYTYSDYLAHQDNELYHFGIKGMKWGVRKDRGSSGGSSRTPLTPEQRAARKAKLKKAGKIALQTAGAAAMVGAHAHLYRKAKKAGNQHMMNAVKRNAVKTAGGLGALYLSERLRKQSMRTEDPKLAQRQRRASRILGYGGALQAPVIATAPYAIHRMRDKERRRRDPEKYRKMGYVRN